MQHERALHHLEELRGLVSGDTEEMVDTLARIIILQKEVSNPMYGAKVTYYTRPDTKDSVRVEPEEALEPGDDEWNWQWTKTYAEKTKYDENRYYFQEKVDPDDPDLLSHRAIVYEPFVAEAPDGVYYDPERDEYRRPDDYPMGTVNLIYSPEDGRELGSEEYVVDVETATSVTPADGDPGPSEYTPGW